MHVRWDQGAAATPHLQWVFFAEFLAATGVFERWVSSCPLEYRRCMSDNTLTLWSDRGTLIRPVFEGTCAMRPSRSVLSQRMPSRLPRRKVVSRPQTTSGQK
jgi:hypothetical protein